MPVQMRKVISSHVLEIGYDAENSQLIVRFAPTMKNPAGALVAHHGVDPDTAESVMSAPSMGQSPHRWPDPLDRSGRSVRWPAARVRPASCNARLRHPFRCF